MTQTNAPGAADASKEQAIALVDASFLAELRAKMHKFARLQLSDDDLAEDVVQEALMGALRNAKSFGGRAALKTWVFAILKNKIADALRQRSRLVQASSLLDSEEVDLPALFDEKGAWRDEERPRALEHVLRLQEFPEADAGVALCDALQSVKTMRFLQLSQGTDRIRLARAHANVVRNGAARATERTAAPHRRATKVERVTVRCRAESHRKLSQSHS